MDKNKIKKLEKKFNEFLDQEKNKLDKEKKVHQENIRILESLKCKDSEIFDLNIGGTHKISTSKITLTKVKIIEIKYKIYFKNYF